MTSVFLHLLNMSITAGWLVLAVVLLRLVFRRAPKWIHCLLWVLVAVRLLCPVSIESVLSLIPSAETVPVDTFLYETPVIHSGVPVVDAVVNPVISNGFAPTPENSVNPMQVATTVAAYVWVAGIAAMLLYAVISTLRLRWRVREAAFVRENIWQCDRIATPFILGIFRPRIYLPTLLGAEETHSVVAHEQAHLSRKDHWWKPLGFLLLTVYWFNPLLWVGYVLLCRDIEAACDQRVVRNMDAEGRKEYSRVLLACSAPRHLVTACPLAFGETGVKSRIRSVLNYKKPAFWLVITAIVATVVAAVCLLTNPAGDEPTDTSTDSDELPITQAILAHNQVESGPDIFACESHEIYTTVEEGDKTTVYALVYYHEYMWEKDALVERSGSLGPAAITFKKNGNIYDVVEYWTPGDTWAEDIRAKFPEAYWERALDYANYPVERMKQECLDKAYAYFGLDGIYNAPLTFSAMNHLPKDKSAKLFAKLPVSDAIQYLPVIPMTNRGELDAFIAEYKEDMNFDRAEGDGLTPAHQMSFYDDAFFADHVLLAVYYQNGSCSVQPKIGGISYVFGSTELTVQVDVYEPEAGDTALGQWFMLCEVNRAAIPNVQNYTAVVRSCIPLGGTNTFTGRVKQVTVDGKQMLMDCYDADKFTEVWVSLQNIPDANPQVGEEYVVTHDQWVLETYPPHVTALRIIPVSSTPSVSDSPLSLTMEAAPAGALLYEDTAVAEHNYTLALTAQKDLTQVRLVSLDPDSSMVNETLYTLPALTKGQRWYIRTYINDAVANRGVVCTDKQGTRYSFAFTYSGRDGTISLKPLKNIDITTTITTKTDGTTMTEAELLALCKSKIQCAQQIEGWYMGGSHYTTTIPEGTATTLLNGETYVIEYDYYPLADDFLLDGAMHSGEVITAAALKQQIESVYTTAFAHDRYYDDGYAWVVYNGDVYHVTADGVIPEVVDPNSVTDIQAKKDTITFRVKTYSHGDEENIREMKLTYIEGDWKFDELV